MASLSRNFLSKLAKSTRLTAHMPKPYSSSSSTSSSSASGVPQGSVYELRVYSLKPDKFGDYLSLMKEHFHPRLKASMPMGFWTSELGGIFQAIHIWPYDSVEHRAQVRQALAGDKEWTTNFISKFLTYADNLDNSLLVLYPGTTVNTEFAPSDKAAYEIQTVANGGGPVQQSEQETIVARFKCVYGSASGAEYRLMRYPDANTAFANACKRQESGGVISQSKLMFPLGFSPLK